MPDDLMRARHETFGVADVPDNDFYRDNGWSKVDESTPTAREEQSAQEAAEFERGLAESGARFDPSAHTVAEVQAYLAGDIDQMERTRVLDAELNGQARKTLVGED